jgi:hypothetical protein
MPYPWSCLKCPRKTCLTVESWNFEKAHSILHKLRDFCCFDGLRTSVIWALTHGHINNCKRLANCTNNKEVYLTVLRTHSREGHLQYLRSLEADLAAEPTWRRRRMMVLRNL